MPDEMRAEVLLKNVAPLLVDETDVAVLVVKREGNQLHASLFTQGFPLDDFRGAVEHLKTNLKRLVVSKIRTGDISEQRGRELLRQIELGDGKEGGEGRIDDSHVGNQRGGPPDPSGDRGAGDGEGAGSGLEPALPSGA